MRALATADDVRRLGTASGTVKFFNTAKGFGFIAPDAGGADVFVHATALEGGGLRALNEGDRVTFEVEEDRRSGKLAATDLRVTDAGSGSTSVSRPDQRCQSNFRPHGAAPPPVPRAMPVARPLAKWRVAAEAWSSGSTPPRALTSFSRRQVERTSFHISAVERAGLRELRDGERVSFDIKRDARSGKTAAANLRVED